MNSEPLLNVVSRGQHLELSASGSWTAVHSDALEHLVDRFRASDPSARMVAIDMAGVQELDTLGAWLLESLARGRSVAGGDIQFRGLPTRFQGLFDKIGQLNRRPRAQAAMPNRIVAAFQSLGRETVGFKNDLIIFFDMLGSVSIALARVLARPFSFRLTSTVHHLNRVGWQAIPIMLLITFLIGSIIAQQGFFHFRKFGADAYVVDMVGILVLRELGVLIVSIMVAGRSGSAYTAELGSMKMREEIDALRTMGLDPVEILILPRILALVCALPILTFFGSMAALYGGGLVAWFYGGMSPDAFISRLREAISVTHFEVGMIKAPFMALMIGIVACSEGLQVQGSAESLGLRTTTSVVKSIFLVIVLDGMFAIFFASIGM
jgi:phospholipid/cholesterol/gamma-HCH transport system permease protein